eukprot:2585552-Rhodomonas_salina.2
MLLKAYARANRIAAIYRCAAAICGRDSTVIDRGSADVFEGRAAVWSAWGGGGGQMTVTFWTYLQPKRGRMA